MGPLSPADSSRADDDTSLFSAVTAGMEPPNDTAGTSVLQIPNGKSTGSLHNDSTITLAGGNAHCLALEDSISPKLDQRIISDTDAAKDGCDTPGGITCNPDGIVEENVKNDPGDNSAEPVNLLASQDRVREENSVTENMLSESNGTNEAVIAGGIKEEPSKETSPVVVSVAESRPVRRPLKRSYLGVLARDIDPLLEMGARKRHLVEWSTTCPVCGVTVRDHELKNHLSVEIQRLNKISTRRSYSSSNCGRSSISDSASVIPIPPSPSPSTSAAAASSSQVGIQSSDATETTSGQEAPLPPSTPDSRYNTYQRVKSLRQSRLAALAERHKKRNAESAMCPVCNKEIVGSPEELTDHVDLCLTNPPVNLRTNDEDGEVDVEGDDYEEYTWAGQTRIRATTMLPGGLAASGFAVAKKSVEDEDDDLDLVVDDDDVQNFGEAQYNEVDIIPCSSDEPTEEKQRKALRKAFLTAQGESLHGVPSDRKRWEHSKKGLNIPVDPGGSSGDGDLTPPTSSDHSTNEEVICALKCRIAEQEEQLKKLNIPKCLICMESYHKPLTSVQCWHVHCEECWLRTLGAKKVCPQCNVITSASDLRQIYL